MLLLDTIYAHLFNVQLGAGALAQRSYPGRIEGSAHDTGAMIIPVRPYPSHCLRPVIAEVFYPFDCLGREQQTTFFISSLPGREQRCIHPSR
jgi:hypothetical protein